MAGKRVTKCVVWAIWARLASVTSAESAMYTAASGQIPTAASFSEIVASTAWLSVLSEALPFSIFEKMGRVPPTHKSGAELA